MPNEEEDLKEFDEQRQKVNQARADTQAERKKIQQRRQEIEQGCWGAMEQKSAIRDQAQPQDTYQEKVLQFVQRSRWISQRA